MMMFCEMTLEDAEIEAVGNWKRFDCFVWFRDDDVPDPDNRAIIYTQSRDSGLLSLSNADVIAKAMEPFTEGDNADVVKESHSHWAVGHIDGFSIQVYREGEITDAFKTYHDLAEQMDGYPTLDEEDYSRREYEAILENIADAAWRMRHGFHLPEGWEYEVFSWFDEHRQRAVIKK